MKHIDALINAKQFWGNIPDDARDAVISAYYILYGSYGFGNNDLWLKDIPEESITAAANNITLNAEKFTKYMELIKIIAEMLEWDSERMTFFNDTLRIYNLSPYYKKRKED